MQLDLKMIQSYPAAFARAHDIFQFGLGDDRSSLTPPGSSDEVLSSLSENEESSRTESFEENCPTSSDIIEVIFCFT